MILIKSIEDDLSTNDVVKWILHLNETFHRLNNISDITNIRYINKSFIIEYDTNKSIDFKSIKSYWYRRGDFRNRNDYLLTKNEKFDNYHLQHLKIEHKSLSNYLIDYIKNNIYSIGDSKLGININKCIVLDKAKSCGLNVPDFIITTKKSDVEKFKQTNTYIITKAINNTFYFFNNGESFITYTERITNEILKKIPNTFSTSFFQKEIPKSFEVRTFYVKGLFYSMAIFSQKDNKTKVDFRKYNHSLPNRNVPFKLPTEIESKINNLMIELNLESGSIDFIYGKDRKFYFLEVNPIGQFGMVSYQCNYQLEKRIAELLINHD
jgi:ATP-GRASP peptide maturase of grasp-with-spasm system